MDYNALANRVNSLINKYSELPISYTKVDTTGYEKHYDPSSDTYKWYLNGVEAKEPTATTYTGKCLETNISEYYKVRGFAKEQDKVFLTIGIPKPNTGDTITVDGQTYSVVRVSKVKPSTVDLLYRITARI